MRTSVTAPFLLSFWLLVSCANSVALDRADNPDPTPAVPSAPVAVDTAAVDATAQPSAKHETKVLTFDAASKPSRRRGDR